MEQRNEPRTPLNEPVLVTEMEPPDQSATGGVLKNVSGSGMLVRMPHEVADHSLVKVETKDMLMLGEVVRCERDGDSFNIALALRHSLQSLTGLASLNHALMDEESAENIAETMEDAVPQEVRVRTRSSHR